MNDNGRAGTRPSGPDLILHPLRMRIIQAMAGGGPATAAELAERLPDVAPATLYRHLNLLRSGGILAVAEERRVRGATERRFVLHAGAASLGPADLAAATREDHLRWFATFLAGLIDAFGRYLDRGEPDLARDGVGYREVILQLADDEIGEMALGLNAVLAPLASRPPGEGRTPRLLATVLVPLVAPAAPASTQAARETAP